jgi:signal transduction histidine kinase
MHDTRANHAASAAIAFPGILLAGHLFSLILYQGIKGTLIDPYNSTIDFRILVLLAMADVAFLAWFSKKTLNVLFLTIQLVLILFMLTLANNDRGITLVLSSAFLISCGYFLKRPSNVAFASLAGIAILCFQQSIRVGGLLTPAPGAHDIMTLVFLFAILIALDFLLSTVLDSHQALNELIRNQRNTIVNLVETNVGIQKYAVTKKEEFENAERLRITRDIHDTVGYVLTNNITLLRACSYYVPQRLKKAHSFLDDALKNATDGLNETRAVLRKLRDITRADGMVEIDTVIRLFRESTGIKVTFDLGNTSGRWGSSLDAVFYRVIQEALVNSVRHGKATEVSVSFWKTETELVLNISDNGQGADDEAGKGIGLLGMQERLSFFQGTLDARRYPYGFVLSIRVPLARAHEEMHEDSPLDVRR